MSQRPKREQQNCPPRLYPTYQLGGCEMGGGVVGFTDSTLGVWPQFGVTWELLNPNFSAQVVLPTGRHKASAIHTNHSQTPAAF